MLNAHMSMQAVEPEVDARESWWRGPFFSLAVVVDPGGLQTQGNL